MVSTPLKNTGQLGLLIPIYGKHKHVPNHRPLYYWLYQGNQQTQNHLEPLHRRCTELGVQGSPTLRGGWTEEIFCQEVGDIRAECDSRLVSQKNSEAPWVLRLHSRRMKSLTSCNGQSRTLSRHMRWVSMGDSTYPIQCV